MSPRLPGAPGQQLGPQLAHVPLDGPYMHCADWDEFLTNQVEVADVSASQKNVVNEAQTWGLEEPVKASSPTATPGLH